METRAKFKEIQENSRVITSKTVSGHTKMGKKKKKKKRDEWVLFRTLYSSTICCIPLSYNTLLSAVIW